MQSVNVSGVGEAHDHQERSGTTHVRIRIKSRFYSCDSRDSCDVSCDTTVTTNIVSHCSLVDRSSHVCCLLTVPPSASPRLAAVRRRFATSIISLAMTCPVCGEHSLLCNRVLRSGGDAGDVVSVIVCYYSCGGFTYYECGCGYTTRKGDRHATRTIERHLREQGTGCSLRMPTAYAVSDGRRKRQRRQAIQSAPVVGDAGGGSQGAAAGGGSTSYSDGSDDSGNDDGNDDGIGGVSNDEDHEEIRGGSDDASSSSPLSMARGLPGGWRIPQISVAAQSPYPTRPSVTGNSFTNSAMLNVDMAAHTHCCTHTHTPVLFCYALSRCTAASLDRNTQIRDRD